MSSQTIDVDALVKDVAATAVTDGASAPSAAAPTVSAEALQHPFTINERAVIAKVIELGRGRIGQELVVGGWVKTGRVQGKGAFAFLEINDGSTPHNLQVMVNAEVYKLEDLIPTGTSVLVRGVLKETPEGKKSPVEVAASEVLFVGPCDAQTYPVAKTKLTLEFLRSIIHFRVRTNTIAAIARIRNALAQATHNFFQSNGFLYVHTPFITSSDCEGAGEMFQVTSLLSHADEIAKTPKPTPEELEASKKAVTDQAEAIRALKEAGGDKKAIKDAVDKLTELKADVKAKEERLAAEGGLPRDPATGKIDYSKDFFGKPAYLTVSGQLEAEIYACALSSVYTFGPTFRAENSHTTRHLAEFWMIEPEIAFCDLQGVMKCAEQYVQHCCKHLLATCRADMEFIVERYDKTAIERLEHVASTPMTKVSYTEAIKILEEHVAKGKKFEEPVSWGIDLASEHERYLAEEVFKAPIIVYNYPKEIKSFYMRLNDDGKTVAACDLLVPKVGELVGGSQREERPDILEQRIQEVGLDKDTYNWYIDLRRYGTVPHGGFGLGFERLVLFATGIENIRDVIPFPRYPGHIL